jgi:NAD(P)-dependent dehydrogenase (short-subunit alcohol dehydrogenase family)
MCAGGREWPDKEGEMDLLKEMDLTGRVSLVLGGASSIGRASAEALFELDVVIDIASIAGLTGSIGPDGYGHAKHGVVGLTKTAAYEHAAENIRVNAVRHGHVATGMTKRTG